MYFYPIALLTLALVLIDAGFTKRSPIDVINGKKSTATPGLPSSSNAAAVAPSAGGNQLGSFPLAKLGGGSYIDPFSGWNIGRTDQGVDVSTSPGTNIPAIGNSKVIGIIPNWYKGQPFVWLQLLDGPDKGKYYYYAEQIKIAVSPGQLVKKGQAVGQYASAGTGVEAGLATASGQTVARATTGYTEGQATDAGKAFRNFLGL